MTPRTIFTLVLKLFGLSMIIGLLEVLPTIVGNIYVLMDSKEIGYSLLIVLLNIGIVILYIIVMRLMFFKSGWIIDKLSLDKHFDQETVDIKVDSAAVIQIAIIVLGGVLFIDALPILFKEVILYLQQKSFRGMLLKDDSFSYMVLHICKVVIGYLMVTNSKRLTAWTEQKNQNP